MSQSQRVDGLPEIYYAPRFEVTVDGQTFTHVEDVLSCKVTADIASLTSFELSIDNWDNRHDRSSEERKKRKFKYVDSGVFDLGKRIAISMGYADRLVPMMTGLITAMTPRYPESGPPSLSVSGQDDMILLKGRKPGKDDKKTWTKARDWEIAEEIAKRNNLSIDLDPADERNQAPEHDEVIQKNQDDATFLMERAKRIDHDCFIRTDLKQSKSTLVFKKPTDKRDGAPIRSYVFTYGAGLIDFSPRLTIANQVAKVTVRGWDPMKKEVIEFTADAGKLPGAGGGESGPDIVARALGSKQDMVLDAPVKSQAEAEQLATSILTEKAYNFVTGSGRCIGLPQMRPGDVVELNGLGDRFSGDYYVTKVDHSIAGSGYVTQFEVRRIHHKKATS
jgi:phage protein D